MFFLLSVHPTLGRQPRLLGIRTKGAVSLGGGRVDSVAEVWSSLQPRNVAGFRGTVRYASVNAHKNRVSERHSLS